MKILVVGAGFAGSTVARELAEAGHEITVIDARDHIAGNAYDFINEHGIRVHKYGPHLWHTSNDEVQEWASKFTEWVDYRHSVTALREDGTLTPLPINHQTIIDVFGEEFEEFALDSGDAYLHDDTDDLVYLGDIRKVAAKFLETKVTKHDPVTNSREHVENSVGVELCNLFFAPYTKKMWGLELEDLPASVAARIPTNVESGSFEYFPKDKYQCIPKAGYTAMVGNILNHPNITVRLDSVFVGGQVWRNGYRLDTGVTGQATGEGGWDHVFTSQPIDTYFDCSLGELPWRSIKMNTYSLPLPEVYMSAVTNFTNDGPFTRVTEWKQLPAHGTNPYWTTVTVEEPCDYKDNDHERYYPVKTSQRNCPNRALYNEYVDLAEQQKNVTFIGRCGTYQYLDMWAVIAQSLKIARDFIKEHP